MIKFYFFLVAFILSGCVSQIADFDEHAKSWLGEDINEFIRVYDQPNDSRSDHVGIRRVTKNSDGNTIYEFAYLKCPVFIQVQGNIITQFSGEDDKERY